MIKLTVRELVNKEVPMPQLNPLIKYVGGKRILAPKIQEFYNNERLIEPFVGGASVVLALAAQKAVLNDINPHVINLYQHVQKGLKPSITPFINTEEQYYANRARFNELIRNHENLCQEGAELYYYLVKTSTNGLSRFNLKGEFNAAKGSYEKVNYLTDFSEYQRVFNQWVFTCGDFEKVELKSGDFIYADPPYDDTFTKYSKGGFSWDDQTRLANWLAQHDGRVVVSNSATDRILELYENLGFKIEIIELARKISMGKGDKREPAKEMFAVKD